MQKVILLLFIFISSLIAQEELTVTGDLLKGGKIGKESVQEWVDNVVMTQGEVKITCNRAIRFLARNEVELIGNVVAVQDTITILTEHIRYFGDTKYAYSDKAIILNDGHTILSAKSGFYYFNEKRARFKDEVDLFDGLNKLSSNLLIYYNDINKSIATGDVRISDSLSSIKSDSLINFKEDQLTYAYGNVKITNPENNIVITGEYLEDLGKTNYTKITGNPLLTQIDTSSTGELDTLLISSMILESEKDSLHKLIASDSVKIIRGQFSSVNDKTIYIKEEERIFIARKNDETKQPVLWYDNSQLLGDTINIFIKNNNLNYIDIVQNAFLLSYNSSNKNRFDQIMGDSLKIFFKENNLNRTEVDGSVLSIYYNYDKNEPGGLIKSSSGKAKIYFEDNFVTDVKLYKSPKTEYHPEKLVTGKELEFTLPAFQIHKNKPPKEELLNKPKK
ncbi:MAG: LPS export ABC transporter periplasmic protein LptC [Melioribacteraceae bacterium]|nr:LPS export ABC transporter periplasmic protein LptC [Melioribacteraceae bacterium]